MYLEGDWKPHEVPGDEKEPESGTAFQKAPDWTVLMHGESVN